MDRTTLMKASHPLERSVTPFYLVHRLLHREHFCELYLSQLIAIVLYLLRSTPVPLHCALIHLPELSDLERVCRKLSHAEKVVEEVLIDLMEKKVMSVGIQVSSMRGVQASPSTARGSRPS
jgi:hypothetical protein